MKCSICHKQIEGKARVTFTLTLLPDKFTIDPTPTISHKDCEESAIVWKICREEIFEAVLRSVDDYVLPHDQEEVLKAKYPDIWQAVDESFPAIISGLHNTWADQIAGEGQYVGEIVDEVETETGLSLFKRG